MKLQEERRCVMPGTHSDHSTCNLLLQSLMLLSAQSNTQSRTTLKKLGDEATVGSAGPCNTHDGSLVEAEEARGKVSAGCWHCQQG